MSRRWAEKAAGRGDVLKRAGRASEWGEPGSHSRQEPKGSSLPGRARERALQQPCHWTGTAGGSTRSVCLGGSQAASLSSSRERDAVLQHITLG